MVIDFAQNWAHKRQDEIQGAYWSRSQTTLYPIIIYYPCPENCHHLICDEVIAISEIGEPEKGMCQHYHRHFFYASDIDRSIKLSPQTLQGT